MFSRNLGTIFGSNLISKRSEKNGRNPKKKDKKRTSSLQELDLGISLPAWQLVPVGYSDQ